ncbi:MAG: hypothetical protein WCG27_04165 [Pseudomonadota bacterium]
MEKVVFDRIRKDAKKLPVFILRNLQRWAHQVEMLGIREVRKIPGYHDESLKGDRLGQRSIRLSMGYRAIYREITEGHLIQIRVTEVHKHDY